jgi:hypothetical protein
LADVDDGLVEIFQQALTRALQARINLFRRAGCELKQAKRLAYFFHVFVEGFLTSSRGKIPREQLKATINTGFEFIYADMAANQST